MSQSNPNRRNIVIAIVILLIIALILLLTLCRPKTAPIVPPPKTTTETPVTPAPPAPAKAVETAKQPDEVLTPAKISAPASVPAGSALTFTWTGPNNKNDHIVLIKAGEPDTATNAKYRDTSVGPTLKLTAPIEPGQYELRYVTGRSRTILGRSPVEITPVAASLEAPAEIPLGAPFAVAWTGPNNKDDYVTIGEKGAPDAKYASYSETSKGASLTLTAPTVPGEHELRYISGEGKKVLARRPIIVLAAEVSITAPEQAIAGAEIEFTWTGPNNKDDSITIVPKGHADGQYGKYWSTSNGSPARLATPIMEGEAELRYMTGQGHRILARRPIRIVAAQITLDAPAEAIAGSTIEVAWTGPNNKDDSITIVAKDANDGQYGKYAGTASGSPAKLIMPIMEGEAELRYMAGQGNKVLARRALRIVPAQITMTAPAEVKPEAQVSITWTGPNHRGDYITIVKKSTPDGQYGPYSYTTKGSPLTVKAPKDLGDAEIRYCTEQGNKVLARIPLKVVP